MSTDPPKPSNPLAQLRQAERNLALALLDNGHAIGMVGTTVMQAVLARQRQARDAALLRIAAVAEESQEMAQEVADAFLKTAAGLRGDVAQNEEPNLPELMGPPPGPEQPQTPALPAPAQPKAIVPRKPRGSRKAARPETPALSGPAPTSPSEATPQ